MIRIIHLSDFHLNPKTLKDWKNYIKDSLIKKLAEINADKHIDLILFTGDLIHKGGKEYDSAAVAFNLFKMEIIDPILTSLSLPIDKFLIIPGNHDIVRDKDSRKDELGLKAYFNEDYSNISTFMDEAIKTNSFHDIERIKDYVEFENDLYKGIPNSQLSMFGSSFKYQIGNEKIGVCCLDSSWRCYDKNDNGNLLIGEEQLVNNSKFVSDCTIKIALVHHPLDWLSLMERSIISSHISKDFDILLVGHIHSSMTSVHNGVTGTLFIDVAPAGLYDIRSDSRLFSNGFTVIDFDKSIDKIDCEYWRYLHNTKEFVANTDMGDEGKFSVIIPDKPTIQKQTLIKNSISNIKEDHYKLMDEHLIGVKAHVTSLSIKDAFIMPPIDQGDSGDGDSTEYNLTISDIVKTKSDLMFFGGQETGKTTLLYRLVREYIDEFEYIRKLPVYLDFEELGNKEIIPVIKEYLRCGTEDAKTLLSNNQLVLLVDNLDYKTNGSNHDQITKLHKFAGDFQEIQIIATGEDEISGLLLKDYIELCKIPFTNFFIRNLRTKEIKSIMKQWLPLENELKSEEKLNKLINSFQSFALPSTAMSVSLFLWSTENTDRKPINHAVLLEIYIEIILEKLSKENVYRDKFDFTNKIQLLAKIAQEMLLSNRPGYSILYSEFVKVIETYLTKLVGFDIETEVIVQYFLERKIFIKHQGDQIKFTYCCFFHFFIAKRMEYDPAFRDYVMEEERYWEFSREIDFYTGLTRSDINLFKQVLERFEKEFKPHDSILQQVDIDNYFTYQKKKEQEKKEFEPVAKSTAINTIKDNRPSVKKMEDHYNRALKQIPDPGKIIMKGGSKSLETLLIIMSNVLRNSEGVEDLDLKKKAYNLLLKYGMTWMILYREYLIDYVIKNKKLPPAISSEISLDNMLKNIPLYFQVGMDRHLATQKLSNVILAKIKVDTDGNSITKSDIESFLSVALYADIQGKEFPKYLRSFVRRVKNTRVRDYIYYKIIDYYYRRTKEGSPNEEIYLELLTILRIKSQKLPKRMTETVRKAFEDGKKKFNSGNRFTFL